MRKDKKFRATVLGTNLAAVGFVAKTIHDLAECQTDGCVLEYASPEDEPPEETADDDMPDADIIVVADNDVRSIAAIKDALRYAGYPGIVVAVIASSAIPTKKSDEPESEWDRKHFHFGGNTTRSELSRWLSRRIDDVNAFHVACRETG